MKDIIEYFRGIKGPCRRNSNGTLINEWNLLSCHPAWSHTWHWLVYWVAPCDLHFRWWTLGFRFKKQKLLRKTGYRREGGQP